MAAPLPKPTGLVPYQNIVAERRHSLLFSATADMPTTLTARFKSSFSASTASSLGHTAPPGPSLANAINPHAASAASSRLQVRSNFFNRIHFGFSPSSPSFAWSLWSLRLMRSIFDSASLA